jgi:hypothetical protein
LMVELVIRHARRMIGKNMNKVAAGGHFMSYKVSLSFTAILHTDVRAALSPFAQVFRIMCSDLARIQGATRALPN